jgi:hypothetical protein
VYVFVTTFVPPLSSYFAPGSAILVSMPVGLAERSIGRWFREFYCCARPGASEDLALRTRTRLLAFC